MSKLFDRRDFLLHVAPLVAAPALIVGSVEEIQAQQIKNFRLITPAQNAQFNVGQTVQISVGLIRTLHPKIRRIDFKANGQVIGTLSNRNIYQMNWQPTLAGNYTLTAEAVLVNGTVVTSMSIVVSVAASSLEVLYDKLGNATTGWGWIGQGGYFSTISDSLSLNYFVTTSFVGTISAPKRIRSIQLVVQTFNRFTNEIIPVDRMANNAFFAVWNENIGSFYQDPLGGSVARVALPSPNLGSTTVPVGEVDGYSVYLIGWNNLDVPLPANVPLEMSVQFAESGALGDSAVIHGSSFPGPEMRRASSETGNGRIGQPLAFKVEVSN